MLYYTEDIWDCYSYYLKLNYCNCDSIEHVDTIRKTNERIVNSSDEIVENLEGKKEVSWEVKKRDMAS